MRRRFLAALLLIAPVLAFLTIVLFYPLALMVYRSFTDPSVGIANYEHIVRTDVYSRVISTTLEVSAIVTLLSLLLGYPLAYAAANGGPRARLVLLAAVMMPFWTSLLVRTYAWVVLLRAEGPIMALLRFLGDANPPQLLFNRFGAIVGMVYVMLPYMVLSVFSVMNEIDPNLHRAARSLGAGPFRAFVHVYLPHSYPGITGGVLLVFIISLGFFVTPALLGGRKEIFIAQLIQINVQDVVNWGFASALAVVLLALIMILLFVYDRLLGNESVFAAGLRRGRA
jgi:ABC-type spermidine/putrescine transport system permease subunit I